MTTTDELRRLLDERGVKWSTNETLTDCWTRWNAGEFRCTATEINGTFAFTVGNSTPEQAIAATLGRGECELINAADDLGKGTSSCMCSECGYTALDDWWGEFKYCPSCGRRIKED